MENKIGEAQVSVENVGTSNGENEEDNSCKYCGKVFQFHSSKIKHVRIHTGERPYLCQFEGCNRRFSQVSNLVRHVRIHDGSKPFVCNVCKKCFTSSSNLKQHANIHYSTKKRTKLICFIQNCNKSYLYICTLKKHLSHQHKEELSKIQSTFNSPNFNYIYKSLKKGCFPSDSLNFVNFDKSSCLEELDENDEQSKLNRRVRSRRKRNINQKKKKIVKGEAKVKYNLRSLKKKETPKEKIKKAKNNDKIEPTNDKSSSHLNMPLKEKEVKVVDQPLNNTIESQETSLNKMMTTLSSLAKLNNSERILNIINTLNCNETLNYDYETLDLLKKELIQHLIRGNQQPIYNITNNFTTITNDLVKPPNSFSYSNIPNLPNFYDKDSSFVNPNPCCSYPPMYPSNPPLFSNSSQFFQTQINPMFPLTDPITSNLIHLLNFQQLGGNVGNCNLPSFSPSVSQRENYSGCSNLAVISKNATTPECTISNSDYKPCNSSANANLYLNQQNNLLKDENLLITSEPPKLENDNSGCCKMQIDNTILREESEITKPQEHNQVDKEEKNIDINIPKNNLLDSKEEKVMIFKKSDQTKVFSPKKKSERKVFEAIKESEIERNKVDICSYDELPCKFLFQKSKVELQTDKLSKCKNKSFFTNLGKIDLPLQCKTRCSEYLSCPELMPINCETFQQNGCCCVTTCKKKEALFENILKRYKF